MAVKGKKLNEMFYQKADGLADARRVNKKPQAEDFADEVQRENLKEQEAQSGLPPITASLEESASFVGCSARQLRNCLQSTGYLQGCFRTSEELWSRQVIAHKSFIRKKLGLSSGSHVGNKIHMPANLAEGFLPNKESLIRLGGIRIPAKKQNF